MNKLDTLFKHKKNNILSVYFTAGYPKLEDTKRIVKALEQKGVDLIEIGMPFSDPVADGPIIQESSTKALQNGMSLNLLFSQLKNIRAEADIPIVLMGYFNPILQYGVEDFCKAAQAVGVDGLIVPDLPFELYLRDYKHMFAKYNLHLIHLVTPLTSEERMSLIDQHSTSFIYAVSSASTTGTKKVEASVLKSMSERLENLSSPTLIGFGISDKTSLKNAFKYANGAIIGSAFVKKLAEDRAVESLVDEFIEDLQVSENYEFMYGF